MFIKQSKPRRQKRAKRPGEKYGERKPSTSRASEGPQNWIDRQCTQPGPRNRVHTRRHDGRGTSIAFARTKQLLENMKQKKENQRKTYPATGKVLGVIISGVKRRGVANEATC